jgi:hypothetical protein
MSTRCSSSEVGQFRHRPSPSRLLLVPKMSDGRASHEASRSGNPKRGAVPSHGKLTLRAGVTGDGNGRYAVTDRRSDDPEEVLESGRSPTTTRRRFHPVALQTFPLGQQAVPDPNATLQLEGQRQKFATCCASFQGCALIIILTHPALLGI